ncbi:hypothetical protein C0992_004087 [Termitomyces sp. T32_za158]|nr:hypothetical protein C0992_004087 [Termitomyces sp. T32_za158]
MSSLARFLRPLPASSRTYSSFFSSRSGGGGRYFTSAKVPKVVVASKGAAPKAEPAPESTQDAAQTSATNGNANPVISTADKPSAAPSQTSSTSSTTASQAPGKSATTEVPYSATLASDSTLLQRPPHPVLNPKDFKLHQFFSLHRPLLLLSGPHSILDSANASSFLPAEAKEAETFISTPQWLLDEFPEVTADADAATAQQLARAITMSHAGAAVSWEQTLRRLGLVETDRVTPLQEKSEKKYQDVMMDSTKRKRRKKMKKHKLKKRRKVAFVPGESLS